MAGSEVVPNVRALGHLIRTRRRALRLTQAELAARANISRGVLQKLEEGRGTVTMDSVLRIVSLLSADLVLRDRSAATPPPAPGVDLDGL
ncbi:MAG: helix-turn-helix domain-containing protein [Candidatus Dormibacteria bacterium]